MDFLKDFEKTISKMEGVTGTSEPPRYWHSFGNCVLNKIMSGHFRRGIPQGRVTGLTGPSGAGKSFVLGNLVKNAQDDGAYILVIDSENALDDDYMNAIGVVTDDKTKYNYKSVTTIPQVTSIVSAFIKGYTKEYGTSPDAPRVTIALDSLDMLMTETEGENYSKGVTKGDQGQRNKQLKAMLRTFVQDLKNKNITMVCTSQVYRNQDVMNGEGVWIVSDAVRYSMSQIALLTKLRLKGDKSGDFEGIRMKVQGFKTRFAKPFQSVTIEVPYETGIDPYSGLLEVGIGLGLVKQGGAWYTTNDGEKIQRKSMDEAWYERLLEEIEKLDRIVLSAGEDDEDPNQVDESPTSSRIKKFVQSKGQLDSGDE